MTESNQYIIEQSTKQENFKTTKTSASLRSINLAIQKSQMKLPKLLSGQPSSQSIDRYKNNEPSPTSLIEKSSSSSFRSPPNLNEADFIFNVNSNLLQNKKDDIHLKKESIVRPYRASVDNENIQKNSLWRDSSSQDLQQRANFFPQSGRQQYQINEQNNYGSLNCSMSIQDKENYRNHENIKRRVQEDRVEDCNNSKKSWTNMNSAQNYISSQSSCSNQNVQIRFEEISKELKDKSKMLEVLEEELLDSKTEYNIVVMENTSNKDRILKLTKDNQLMQQQISQMSDTINHIDIATNQILSQLLSVQRGSNDCSVNNVLEVQQEYLSEIVKSNITLRCSLQQLSLKNQFIEHQSNKPAYYFNINHSTKEEKENEHIRNSLNANRNSKCFNGEIEKIIKLISQKTNLVGESNTDLKSLIEDSIKGQVNEKIKEIQQESSKYMREQAEASIKEIDSMKRIGEQINRQNQQSQQQINTFQQSNQQLLLQNNQLISSVQNLEQRCNDLKEQNRIQAEKMKGMIDSSHSEIQQVQESLHNQIFQINQQNQKLQSDIKAYQSTQQELNEQNSSLFSQNEQLQQMINNLSNENQSLRFHNQSLQEDSTIASNNSKNIKDMISQAEEQIRNLHQDIESMKIENQRMRQDKEKMERDNEEKVERMKQVLAEREEQNFLIKKLNQTIQEQNSINKDLQAIIISEQTARNEAQRKSKQAQDELLKTQEQLQQALQKEIEEKDRHKELIEFISSRDITIGQLQEQIVELTEKRRHYSSIEGENQKLKRELDSYLNTKGEFENNLKKIESRVKDVEAENASLKENQVNKEIYSQYLEMEKKLGINQPQILQLIEKLPLAEQEVEIIVTLNEQLRQQVENETRERIKQEKLTQEFKNKFEQLQIEQKCNETVLQQSKKSTDGMLSAQLQSNQQLQTQNQQLIKISQMETSNLQQQLNKMTQDNQLLINKCSKMEQCLKLLVKERSLLKSSKQSQHSSTELIDDEIERFNQSQQDVQESTNKIAQILSRDNSLKDIQMTQHKQSQQSKSKQRSAERNTSLSQDKSKNRGKSPNKVKSSYQTSQLHSSKDSSKDQQISSSKSSLSQLNKIQQQQKQQLSSQKSMSHINRSNKLEGEKSPTYTSSSQQASSRGNKPRLESVKENIKPQFTSSSSSQNNCSVQNLEGKNTSEIKSITNNIMQSLVNKKNLLRESSLPTSNNKTQQLEKSENEEDHYRYQNNSNHSNNHQIPSLPHSNSFATHSSASHSSLSLQKQLLPPKRNNFHFQQQSMIPARSSLQSSQEGPLVLGIVRQPNRLLSDTSSKQDTQESNAILLRDEEHIDIEEHASLRSLPNSTSHFSQHPLNQMGYNQNIFNSSQKQFHQIEEYHQKQQDISSNYYQGRDKENKKFINIPHLRLNGENKQQNEKESEWQIRSLREKDGFQVSFHADSHQKYMESNKNTFRDSSINQSQQDHESESSCGIVNNVYGFSFNDQLQKGKFQFHLQLNTINFSDEAFRTQESDTD